MGSELRGRFGHIFQFTGRQIATAAPQLADHHTKRHLYWQNEYKEACAKFKDSVSITFGEFPVTGGTRLDARIEYGDRMIYHRMVESWEKMQKHSEAAQKYKLEANIYATQHERVYELDPADILYFKIGRDELED